MTEYMTLVILVAIFALVAYLGWRYSRPHASDIEDIKEYARSKNLRVLGIKRGTSYWRYWLRGNLLLSNVARIFVLTAEASNGTRSEIHIAFDPLSKSGQLKVLREETSSS